MRLTLRTLLAYLDDILEPTQAREIGEKVTESGYASALVDRIREVMRRRRLTAPDISGPGSGVDPNSVAEYLDNTLPPDAVADVEKVCLDSDVHLAEVAACHQILTIVLGEPVDVPATTRERMYALGPVAPSLETVGSNGRTPAEAVRNSTGSRTAGGATSGELVPDYLKPAPAWKRFGPVAVGLLVGGFWLSLVWGDLGLFPGDDSGSAVAPQAGTQPDGATAAEDVAAATDPEQSGTDAVTGIGPAGQTQNMEPEAGTTVSQPSATELAAATGTAGTGSKSLDELNGFDPPAPPDATTPGARPSEARMPATVAPSPPIVAAATPTGTAPGVAVLPDPGGAARSTVSGSSNPTANDAAGTPAGVATLTPAVPLPEIVYTSREGVLARATVDGWHVLPHRTLLRKGERIAAPEPFIAHVEIDALNLSLQLHGGTVVEVAGASKDDALILHVIRGRVALRRGPGNPTQPVTIGLLLEDELCHLTLRPGDCVAGVSIDPAVPNGFETALGPNPYVGKLFVINGRAAFHSELVQVENLDGPGWISLTPTDRQTLAATPQRSPLLTTPDWLLDTIELSPVQRRYGKMFETEIDAERPLMDSLPTITSSNPTLASFAVRAMSIMEIYSPLVLALAQVEYGDVRDDAYHGLRQWLARDPENAARLRAELPKVFPPDQIEIAYRLLWGYSAEDGRNKATSEMLVNWLRHDNDVIRQMAMFQIHQMTGQKFDFRATNPEKQRRSSIEQFEALLKKNDGTLLK